MPLEVLREQKIMVQALNLRIQAKIGAVLTIAPMLLRVQPV